MRDVRCPLCNGSGRLGSLSRKDAACKGGNTSYLRSKEPGQLTMRERGRMGGRLEDEREPHQGGDEQSQEEGSGGPLSLQVPHVRLPRRLGQPNRLLSGRHIFSDSATYPPSHSRRRNPQSLVPSYIVASLPPVAYLFVVDGNSLSPAEQVMVQGLQGILAQKEGGEDIWFATDDRYANWLDDLERDHGIELGCRFLNDPWALVRPFQRTTGWLHSIHLG